MTPANFQSEYSSNPISNPSGRPVLQVLGQDHASQNDNGQGSHAGSPPKPQAGFLNQSIDEIARLYVDSPFSW